MLHMQDCITHVLILPADPETVWNRSFGSADALASWFPQSVEGEYGPSGIFELVWGEHRSQARMTAFDPPKTLAFQWHPGDAFALDDHPEDQLTKVTFTLEAEGPHTKVTMVESGFAAIPEDRRDWALGQNTGGWEEELAKLSKRYES